MEFLANPQVWLDLLILTLLEVILGIDNIVFIVLASNQLPVKQQVLARRLGLGLAMLMRLLLLAVIFWLAHLTQVLFSIGSFGFSIRDLVELAGGLFLVIKAIHELYEYSQKHHDYKRKSHSKFWWIIAQIVLLDVIFSLDSVITAVAIADFYTVMAAAIIIAIVVMMMASEPVNYFINRYTRVKLLALVLILLVGILLVLRGLNIEFSEGYLYVAIAILAVIILPPWRKWLKRA